MVDIGSQLGGYSLEAMLGKGGFASLYLGRKQGPGGFSRLAALKVVHPHLGHQEKFRLMFTDEARLNTRVAHPNIVRVEDFGDEAGTLYMILEYVHGGTLAELLQKLSAESLRMRVPLVVWLVSQVADALHAAHEARDEHGKELGIVHRDVSPQNVLLSHAGFVKLIDFGIAKARYRATVTKTGRVKGKLRYMAPEQALSTQIDRRVDIYALAVVAWEMLTMRRAIRAGSPIEVLRQIRSPEIPPAGRLVDVPPALDAVIEQAMSVDPEARPQTARELRRALLHACPEAHEVEPLDLAMLIGSTIPPSLDELAPEIHSEISLSFVGTDPNHPTFGTSASHTDPLVRPGSQAWVPEEDAEVADEGRATVSDTRSPLADQARATLQDSDDVAAVVDVGALLSELGDEAQREPRSRVRDTVQQSRPEVLASLAAELEAPALPQQRGVPTLSVPPPRAASSYVLFTILLVVMAIAVGAFAFLLVTRLL